MTNIRTRFAPSPTGVSGLHAGGVRTALFNWLWARKNNGSFILRIEDTDQERNTQESYQNILTSMKWLGLDYNEGPDIGGDYGPYTQTQRLDLYNRYLNQLIDEGKAYRCYCTPESLNQLREAAIAKGKAEGKKVFFRYPGVCRDLKNHDKNKDHVIRLKTSTEGSVSFTDRVFGVINTPNLENYDFVLARSNGIPLYNFGAVIDDLTMQISHVIRGRDHIGNTPLQLLIYQALGATPPEFAHLPMLLSPTGKKLSKRDNDSNINQYKEKGYTPDAILNYFVRFGWSCGNKEIFSRQEMIDLFNFDSCSKSDGKINPDKMVAIQKAHLKNNGLVPDQVYCSALDDYMKSKYNLNLDQGKFLNGLNIIRPKSKNLEEAYQNYLKI